jgi:hypothetical protein
LYKYFASRTKRRIKIKSSNHPNIVFGRKAPEPKTLAPKRLVVEPSAFVTTAETLAFTDPALPFAST